eukprot:3441688-Rhodomonas_salina.1
MQLGRRRVPGPPAARTRLGQRGTRTCRGSCKTVPLRPEVKPLFPNVGTLRGMLGTCDVEVLCKLRGPEHLIRVRQRLPVALLPRLPLTPLTRQRPGGKRGLKKGGLKKGGLKKGQGDHFGAEEVRGERLALVAPYALVSTSEVIVP